MLLLVEEAKLQLQSDILETKKSISNCKRNLQNALSTFPWNSNNIINLQQDLTNLENGKKALEKLLKDEFDNE